VAAPHHPGTSPPDHLDDPGGLGVVNQHDITGLYQCAQLLGIPAEHPLVVGPLSLAERAAVAKGAIEPVVDPLGDREELRVALDHQPTRVDPCAASIRQERLQHLGDSAAGRRRVDVQHRMAGERGLRRIGDLLVA
jgi:hypothetical protein